jgi:FtsP/CotA-like multicopper oxidase with cupredoxin domain
MMNPKRFPWEVSRLAAALGLLIGAGSGLAAPVPGGTLNLSGVPMFVTPLYIPPAMPTSSDPNDPLMDYQIAVRQFKQQILPTGKPMTTVWGYGSIDDPASFHYPAATIEAEVEMPVRVKWVNDLKDPLTGNFLPHLLPVDQTLHWANPPMDCIEGMPMTDCRGKNQLPYAGPVPIITHLHGAHVGSDSDGYPEAWYLPAAANIPAGYATRGSHFGQIPGAPDVPGQATFEYPNTQRAATLWFHDHSLGMTRANVYAGPVGFYLLRGGVGDVVDNLATKKKGDGFLPAGPYEVPLAIQDKSFNADGSLFFPDNRAFFEGLAPLQLKIPFIPDLTIGGERSDVSPLWNPEFFGNTMVVNGNTWPYLDVEPRQYRLRFLNASDSRFLILTAPGITFHQIGADGGFLPKPEARSELLIGPAERADVIVDFSGLRMGTRVNLLNIGPDEPFGGGTPGIDFDPADPGTTGQVMQFRVVRATGVDNSTPVANLGLPAPAPIGLAKSTRKLSLNEDESATVFVPVDPDTGEYILNNGNLVEVPADNPFAAPFGPTSARLGILDKNGFPVPKSWMDAISENPKLGATEVWEIYNFTADAHPIHIHLVQFEILDRQELVTDNEGMAAPPARLVPGTVRSPDPGETGRKDTVIVYPGEVARVKATFDIAGLFVWHCHILSHEDNEMMRPYHVGPIKPGM